MVLLFFDFSWSFDSSGFSGSFVVTNQGGDYAKEKENMLHLLCFFPASPEVGRAAEDLRQLGLSKYPQREQQRPMAAE
jgi:hypothetical protein